MISFESLPKVNKFLVVGHVFDVESNTLDNKRINTRSEAKRKYLPTQQAIFGLYLLE